MFRYIFILSVLLTLFCYKTIYAQPTNIYTPLCSLVSNTSIIAEFDATTIAYLNAQAESLYPNATRIGDASNTYNCHAYAWYVSEGGKRVWIGTSSATAEDIYWTDGSYIEVSSQTDAIKVSYANDNHSAITTGTNNVFISKWGSWPLMRHVYNDCPYTSSGLKYYSSTREINGAITSGTYKIGGELQSSGQIVSSSDVIFNAGRSIKLKPGFIASNTSFKASLISSCWPASGSGLKSTSSSEDYEISSEIELSDNINKYIKESKDLIPQGEPLIFPNPVTNILYIEGIEQFNVKVFDCFGRLIMTIDDASGGIDVSSLNKGIYFVQITSEGVSYIERVLKQ
jgi:hypothetical protein